MARKLCTKAERLQPLAQLSLPTGKATSPKFVPVPPLQAKRPQQQADLPKVNLAPQNYQIDLANPLASMYGHSTTAPAPVQAKLTVGAVGDQYEQEADFVAAQVVDTLQGSAGSQNVQRETVEEEDLQMKPLVQRKTMEEDDDLQMKPAALQREEMEEDELQMKPLVQRVGAEGGAVSDDFEQQLQSAKGSGQSLDAGLQSQMGQAMGADFSGVKVHTDSQSDQLNQSIQSKAFTTGQDVFFSQGTYNPSSKDGQELIAHELTHVVQQSGKTRHSVQRYHMDVPDYRTSDDGQMGVHQSSTIGGQTAYATPTLIADASKQLKAATSVIELEPGSIAAKLPDIDGKEHDVFDVVPVNTKNKTKDMDMKLWADCGRSAKTVSGMDKGTGQGGASPGAKYNKDGKDKIVTGNDWMEIQKVKMFMDLFSQKNSWWKIWKPTYESKLDLSTINKKLVEYKATKKQWVAEKDENKKDGFAQKMSRLASEMDVLVRSEYEKLGPDAKDDFDKAAGINIYADPNIGEAFHISSGGGDHPDKPADVGTWNFHWAGVVMKSGADTMTLENYSVSDYGKENKDWVFQMYGVGKKGQSFHEEHKDVHQQHGDAPTSMVAVRRKLQKKESSSND
jgi:hypothetical protein